MTLTDRRRRLLLPALLAALVLALPGVARADDPPAEEGESPHPVTEVVSTLPVLGSGLSVTITRDDNGAIASVGLAPDPGATTVKENDHIVVFLLGDGDTEVVVKSAGAVVQTKVKADATTDVEGPGTWSADVFGNGVVTIPYSVTFDGITPTIEIGTISSPDGVSADVGEPKTWTSDDGDKAYYKVEVKLTSAEHKAKVILAAKVYRNDEDELKVKVSATLISNGRVRCRFGDEWQSKRGDDDRWSDESHRGGRWRDSDHWNDREGWNNGGHWGRGDHDKDDGGGDGGEGGGEPGSG